MKIGQNEKSTATQVESGTGADVSSFPPVVGSYNQAIGTATAASNEPPSQPAEPTIAPTPRSTSLPVNSHTKKRPAPDSLQSTVKRQIVQSIAPLADERGTLSGKMANQSTRPIADDPLTPWHTGTARYIDASHWAYFRDDGQEYRNLIQESHNSKPFPSGGNRRLVIYQHLVNLLDTPSTDSFVEYFFLAVQPVFPIVPSDEFNAQYARVLDWDLDLQTELVIDRDPSFLCVLCAVVYCGAAVAPPELWTGLMLNMDKDKIIKELEEGYQFTMKFCKRKFAYPTEYTLTASLLHHSVGRKNISAIEHLTFIAQILREAQYLGLHWAIKSSEFSCERVDWRRQLWFHAISMDSQAAKAHGVIPVHRPPRPKSQDGTVSEIPSVDLSISISMMLAMCRFEAARIETFILHKLSSTFSRQDLKFVQEQIRHFHLTIDQFITAIPASGVPEEGLLSNYVNNAKPFVDKHLYKEANGSEATVSSCWTRMILTMIKHEIDIQYHRAVLFRNTSVDDATLRKLAEACTDYLRVYLHLKRTACYLPYRWFTDQQPPLQVMMCLLKHLKQRKLSKEKETQFSHMARYLVDEVGDIMNQEFIAAETNRRTTGGDESGNGDENGDGSEEGEQMDNRSRSDFATGWRFLSKIKAELDGGGSDAEDDLMVVDAPASRAQWDGSTLKAQ